MQKINFQNLPSTSTPVNATNLNAVQTNVEDVFNGTVPMGNIKVDTVTTKNLFNINGEVNVKIDGSIGNKNSVSGNILTSNINGDLEYSYGQKLVGLNGKTITFSVKCISTGDGTNGIFAIFDNNNPATFTYVGLNQYNQLTYTATSDNIVVGFSTQSGTGAQFTDIQVEIGSTRTNWAEYQNLDTSQFYTKEEADAKFYDKTEINYIGENDDLDNYLTAGCYTNGGQNPAHNPVGNAFVGLLVVFKSYYAAQLLITSDYYYNVYVRFYGGNSWGDWRTLI